MEPCEHCGYEYYHDPKTCGAIASEKRGKIRHFNGVITRKRDGKRVRINEIGISRKTIIALAEYLNERR